jgi:tetratricopeptide (TPR) repeat protein
MTNPHISFKATSLTSLLAPKLSTPTHWATHGLCCLALGLTLLVAGAGTAHAQSVEALEWQPGQSMMPTVISTPHNDVRKLLRQAKYPQALLLVNKGLSNNPRDPQMRFWQGFLFEQLDQPDMALQVYLDLTREYPELAEPHNNLGVIYAAKGDYPNAKASLDAALRANPNYAAAHENMGDLLVNMARQSYERALSVDPKLRGIAQKMDRLQPVLEITQGKP